MTAYEPLDLTSLCNAGAHTADGQEDVPCGTVVLRGLPFSIGGPDAAADRCVIALGPQRPAADLEIPVGKQAHTVTFAHRLSASLLEEYFPHAAIMWQHFDADSLIDDNGPLGEEAAEYVFHLEDGESHRVTVRERFEISAVPVGVGSPFAAFSDHEDSLHPRHEGPWEQTGRRQTEGSRGNARWFVLWVWRNPSPDTALAKIEIAGARRDLVIGGITLGHTGEDPICTDGLRDVRVTLKDADAADSDFDLEVEVDRGFATYPHPLPQMSADQFLADDHRGWGEAQSTKSSPAQVQIAANPSATIAVKQGGTVMGEANWGDALENGSAEDAKTCIEIIDHGRNWVHTTVVDDDTGKPVPCRVHFRSPEGVAYAPHGHHAQVNSNLDSWHIDVGGDVRMGQITYGYIDGKCQGWLPRGEVIVDVARGFEYEPLRTRVSIEPGQRELELRLKRWCHMNEERWFSGDSHVHFLSAQGSHMEANGEDLNVVNMLQSQWGSLFTDTQEFTGGPSISQDGSTIVYVSQENRQHFLGHLILWGLKEPVMPWCSDGLGESEPGGTLEVTMSDWADQCHGQGGTVVIPHLPSPNGEPATLIATGRADAIEMLRHAPYNHNEWYRYLNCGYKLPLVGGTDKMSSDVPVGLYRTYTHIPEDEGDFTYDNWCRNVAAGRTFHSGGPIIRCSVDGHAIGDTVQLPGNGGTVEVTAAAESILPIHTLEIVQEGRVVASTGDAKGARTLSLTAQVKVDGHSWLAARCAGPGYGSIPHHDGWGRGIFAHTSPVYIACGGEWWMFDADTAQYMLTLVDGCIHYMHHSSRQHREGSATHHHGEADHMAYLERPFLQAREAIHRRLHQHRIPH